MRPSPTSSPEESLLASMRLAGIHGIGPGLRRLLFERYGDAAGILAASADELRKVAGIGPRLAEAIAGSDPTAARELLSLCRARGVGILQESDDTFPAILRQIPDPPDLLFVRGSLEPADSLAVAVVGARHATAYGLRVAQRLGGSLARAGYTVVSGLARGIDSAAHQGALEAGGRTIAVLGSGVLEIYPPEHADLAERIEAAGAVISESPPLATASAGAFPRRNRIVSGLSLGVVVVEASTRSGALITARLASEQGREVFAVPGSIESRMSRGCHRLLKDGACLVEGVDDILENSLS
jgi:DNA protecting protein DprA